jgi:hypothetical protein
MKDIYGVIRITGDELAERAAVDRELMRRMTTLSPKHRAKAW